MSINSNFPRVGIIGGAGPMAGALLFQKIIQNCQKLYSCQADADFPSITLLSYPFAQMLQNPDRTQKTLLKEQLNECLFNFVRNDIEIAAIACNTLHEFLDPSTTKPPTFLHMIEEIAWMLQQSQIKHTLVLCSTTAAECQLHKKYFDCQYPSQTFQVQIQGCIDQILVGKQSREEAQVLAYQLNTYLAELEETTIGLVLGCTEFSVFNEQFPLLSNGLDARFCVVDPNQIMAEKICRLVFKNK